MQATLSSMKEEDMWHPFGDSSHRDRLSELVTRTPVPTFPGTLKIADTIIAIVLGIVARSTSRVSHVPPSVYVSIIVLQCIGVLVALLLVDPRRIERGDGRPIARFKHLTWRKEFTALPKTLMTPGILLISLAFFGCQIPISLAGSLNAFYFDARTRALANVSTLRARNLLERG